MLHPYEKLNRQAKKQFQWKIIFILVGVSLIGILLIYLTRSLLPFILVFLALNILASFIDVPLGIKKGNLVRYSPMFLTSAERKQKVQLHGGTLFDYYFCLPQYKTASRRKKAVLLAYLIGLLNLIEDKKESPYTQINGTTYILNRRTAEKLGFNVISSQMGQKLLLVVNYLPLLMANSMVHKKLNFPKLNNSIGISANIETIQHRKYYVKNLIEKLKKADL